MRRYQESGKDLSFFEAQWHGGPIGFGGSFITVNNPGSRTISSAWSPFRKWRNFYRAPAGINSRNCRCVHR